jgi:hypothetical protein
MTALFYFAHYPIVIAGALATLTGYSSPLIGTVDDPGITTNIGRLFPFFMIAVMAWSFILVMPFIVRPNS